MRDPEDLADPARHLASIWRALADATRSPDSAFRTPTFATVGALGAPQARTIVIRSVDAATRRLSIYTDQRSPKVFELSCSSKAALSFWDAGLQVQLRVSGECARVTDDAAVLQAWAQVPQSNRANYRTTLAPGMMVESFDAIDHVEGDDSANFALLRFTATAFDWLWLDRAGHKRAQFDLATTPATRHWLVP